MVEGLESRLGNQPVQRFFLDDQGKPYSLGDRGAKLVPSQYAALVAVGPEALRYLLPRTGTVPLIYGMVLNPELVIGADDKLPCGVSLNIPVRAQLSTIRQHLPAVARLGVLFDPENNQAWFENAATVAASMGMQIVPLRVNRQSAKLDIIGDFSLLDTILFIPDKSIISKAVIQHVIKQAFCTASRSSATTSSFTIPARRSPSSSIIPRLASRSPCRSSSCWPATSARGRSHRASPPGLMTML
jgi:hypothetical protein